MKNRWEYTLKNRQKVVIRQAAVEDAAAYLDYINRIFMDDRFFLTTCEESKEWQTLEKTQERILKFQNPIEGVLLLALTQDKVIAMADITCGQKKRLRHTGSIGISVLPEYRGMGLGTAMMRSLIEWADGNASLEKLMLSVHANNTVALGLYEKMGFVEEGRQPRHFKFSDGQYIDNIQMFKFVK